MDSADHIIPPLSWNCETKEIAFGHPGKPLNIRNASEGHFAIYGDYSSDHGRFVIAISFEEDRLPVLGRQVMYHYLDAADTFVWETEGCLELIIPNYIATPSSELERQAVMWRIRFSPRELITIQSILSNLRLPADLLKVNRLPKAAKDEIYYNLRSNLMELPVPKSMGTIGHWQKPLAGGTPRFPPYVERAFVNQSMREIEDRQQDGGVIESSILDIQQQQEAMDFAKATAADDFERPSGQVILYEEPGMLASFHRASANATPSEKKGTGEYGVPARIVIGCSDSSDASGDETGRASQIRKASASTINQPTQTHGAYNSKRTRRSASPTDKDSKIATKKGEKKSVKDEDGASAGIPTGVRFYSGQTYVNLTKDMGMGPVDLRGGDPATLSETSSESSVLRDVAPSDDWCAVVNDNGEEVCRYRLRDW